MIANQEFAKDIWIFRRPFRLVGVNLSLTMTAIRLPQGELMIHSPVRLSDEIKRTLETLGRVSHVVAPNTLHHLFIRDYGPAFPGAKLYALPALKAKRADVYFHGELSGTPDPAWSETVDQIEIKGLREGMEELAFFHRPSKTVILTDLIFNLPPPTTTWEKTFFALNKLGKGPVCSRVFRLGMIKNKVQLRESVDQILAWKPERMIVTHGLPVESNAEPAITHAFEWLA